jgi:hypothetical protein
MVVVTKQRAFSHNNIPSFVGGKGRPDYTIIPSKNLDESLYGVSRRYAH